MLEHPYKCDLFWHQLPDPNPVQPFPSLIHALPALPAPPSIEPPLARRLQGAVAEWNADVLCAVWAGADCSSTYKCQLPHCVLCIVTVSCLRREQFNRLEGRRLGLRVSECPTPPAGFAFPDFFCTGSVIRVKQSSSSRDSCSPSAGRQSFRARQMILVTSEGRSREPLSFHHSNALS